MDTFQLNSLSAIVSVDEEAVNDVIFNSGFSDELYSVSRGMGHFKLQ